VGSRDRGQPAAEEDHGGRVTTCCFYLLASGTKQRSRRDNEANVRVSVCVCVYKSKQRGGCVCVCVCVCGCAYHSKQRWPTISVEGCVCIILISFVFFLLGKFCYCNHKNKSEVV